MKNFILVGLALFMSAQVVFLASAGPPEACVKQDVLIESECLRSVEYAFNAPVPDGGQVICQAADSVSGIVLCACSEIEQPGIRFRLNEFQNRQIRRWYVKRIDGPPSFAGFNMACRINTYKQARYCHAGQVL
jgi:hypothetical protein